MKKIILPVLFSIFLAVAVLLAVFLPLRSASASVAYADSYSVSSEVSPQADAISFSSVSDMTGRSFAINSTIEAPADFIAFSLNSAYVNSTLVFATYEYNNGQTFNMTGTK